MCCISFANLLEPCFATIVAKERRTPDGDPHKHLDHRDRHGPLGSLEQKADKVVDSMFIRPADPSANLKAYIECGDDHARRNHD